VLQFKSSKLLRTLKARVSYTILKERAAITSTGII
jgi:hypothetical protein